MSRSGSPDAQVRSGLRQGGCPLCGCVIKDEVAVEHERLGRVHERCAKTISWEQPVSGRNPLEFDPSDWGAGFSEYRDDAP